MQVLLLYVCPDKCDYKNKSLVTKLVRKLNNSKEDYTQRGTVKSVHGKQLSNLTISINSALLSKASKLSSTTTDSKQLAYPHIFGYKDLLKGRV